MKTTNEMIASLRNEAKNDPAFNAVAHVFALRKRARSQVTVQALKAKMEKEGFKFEPSKYAQVLKTLAVLGLGRLEVDSKGRVKALKDIKTTLQSIGVAAVGGGSKSNLTGFKSRNNFVDVVVPEPKSPETTPVGLTVSLNGKTLTIPLPGDMTSQEVASLIDRLQNRKIS